VHGPTDPVGKLLFTALALALVVESEADAARMRTRERRFAMITGEVS
jgi:hypothetical protein